MRSLFRFPESRSLAPACRRQGIQEAGLPAILSAGPDEASRHGGTVPLFGIRRAGSDNIRAGAKIGVELTGAFIRLTSTIDE